MKHRGGCVSGKHKIKYTHSGGFCFSGALILQLPNPVIMKRRSQPTPEEEGTEEMVFNWTDEMVSRLLDEISKIRTKHGRYRVLSGTAGFDKKGTCWKELLLSLRTYGEFQGQVLTMKELADRVVQLESLADQVVDINGEPPAEDAVPLHKALYKAFRAAMLPAPGMFNVPSFMPAVRRNVRPKLVQCSDEATSAYAGTSAIKATIPSCTVEDFCALLSPYSNVLTPQQFAWVYNFGNMEDIMEHSRGLDQEEFLNFLVNTADELKKQRHYRKE